jgi:hypothetical protein
MGGVFARAFLRRGYTVQPVLRGHNMTEIAQAIPEPTLILLAVAEKDLHPTLAQIPPAWRSLLVLLQNELLPRDWQQHDIENPTVMSVWFEKKAGQDFKVIIPSPVFGPCAGVIVKSLATLDIPCQPLHSEAELLFELIRKNVYILTTNIAGLITGGTVATLWQQHHELATQVANDVIDIQDWLTHQHSDRQAIIDAMVAAFDGDPDHRCMGRSAPARLANAIKTADEAQLAVPALRKIFNETGTRL